MTTLQSIAIIFLSCLIEAIVLFISVITSKIDDTDNVIAGMAIFNTVTLIVVLLAWANGCKFPLK